MPNTYNKKDVVTVCFTLEALMAEALEQRWNLEEHLLDIKQHVENCPLCQPEELLWEDARKFVDLLFAEKEEVDGMTRCVSLDNYWKHIAFEYYAAGITSLNPS